MYVDPRASKNHKRRRHRDGNKIKICTCNCISKLSAYRVIAEAQGLSDAGSSQVAICTASYLGKSQQKSPTNSITRLSDTASVHAWLPE